MELSGLFNDGSVIPVAEPSASCRQTFYLTAISPALNSKISLIAGPLKIGHQRHDQPSLPWRVFLLLPCNRISDMHPASYWTCQWQQARPSGAACADFARPWPRCCAGSSSIIEYRSWAATCANGRTDGACESQDGISRPRSDVRSHTLFQRPMAAWRRRLAISFAIHSLPSAWLAHPAMASSRAPGKIRQRDAAALEKHPRCHAAGHDLSTDASQDLSRKRSHHTVHSRAWSSVPFLTIHFAFPSTD